MPMSGSGSRAPGQRGASPLSTPSSRADERAESPADELAGSASPASAAHAADIDAGDPSRRAALEAHAADLRQCRQCPDMQPPPVTGLPVTSPVMLLGQAPGRHEGHIGQPFAWTAGKTLFGWFARIGLPEEAFRRRVYMAAVCRCFPGPQPKGGDRVPSRAEIERCHTWLAREVEILAPRLVIPVGRLAMAKVLPLDNLTEIVGRQHRVHLAGHALDAIPLPHPSGVSSWHRTQPGKDLLDAALQLIAGHEAFASLVR